MPSVLTMVLFALHSINLCESENLYNPVLTKKGTKMKNWEYTFDSSTITIPKLRTNSE